jgi:hypothetical protein
MTTTEGLGNGTRLDLLQVSVRQTFLAMKVIQTKAEGHKDALGKKPKGGCDCA